MCEQVLALYSRPKARFLKLEAPPAPAPPKGPSVSDKLKGWMSDATKALGLDEESRAEEKRKKEER